MARLRLTLTVETDLDEWLGLLCTQALVTWRVANTLLYKHGGSNLFKEMIM